MQLKQIPYEKINIVILKACMQIIHLLKVLANKCSFSSWCDLVGNSSNFLNITQFQAEIIFIHSTKYNAVVLMLMHPLSQCCQEPVIGQAIL